MDLLIFNPKNVPRCIDIDMQNKHCGGRNITVSTYPDTRGARQDVVIVPPSGALSILFFLCLDWGPSSRRSLYPLQGREFQRPGIFLLYSGAYDAGEMYH